MSKYVFSTLTASQKYPIWIRIEGHDLPRMQSYVLIHGGANLPSKVLVTPRGVMTKITDEQFDQLDQCPGFKQHVDNGFLTVEDAPHNPETVAEDMEPKDTSAPMVPEDFEKAGHKPPTTGKAEIDDEPNTSSVSSTQRPAQAATVEKAEADKEKTEKPTRRRRGRPPGSKNKTETAGETETAGAE